MDPHLKNPKTKFKGEKKVGKPKAELEKKKKKKNGN